MEDSKPEAVFPKLLPNINPAAEQSKLEPVYPKLPVKAYIYCANRDEDCSSCISAELVTGKKQMYKSQFLSLGEDGSNELFLMYDPCRYSQPITSVKD